MLRIAPRPGTPLLLIGFASLLAVVLLAITGCGDDEKNPMDPGGGGPPTSTSFTGLFVGGGDGGKLSLMIASTSLAPALRTSIMRTAVVNASGTLDLDGGAMIPLSGTYDTATDSLNVSGGGYDLVGVYDSTGTAPGILGSYDGPNGTGFFGCLAGSASAIKTFCGSFENQGTTIAGRWNFLVFGNEIAGGAAEQGSSSLLGFEGTVTGSGYSMQISIAGGGDGVDLTATGTWDLTTNSVSGDWETFDSGTQAPLDSGTWTGSLCD